MNKLKNDLVLYAAVHASNANLDITVCADVQAPNGWIPIKKCFCLTTNDFWTCLLRLGDSIQYVEQDLVKLMAP